MTERRAVIGSLAQVRTGSGSHQPGTRIRPLTRDPQPSKDKEWTIGYPKTRHDRRPFQVNVRCRAGMPRRPDRERSAI
jgi:hypothetical protein